MWWKALQGCFRSRTGSAAWLHSYRNVFSRVPNGKVAEVARMLKTIHAQEDRRAAKSKAKEIAALLKELKLRTAAELVEQRVDETMTYYAYPTTHWRQIRSHWRESFERSEDELDWAGHSPTDTRH
jgi:transposase-like protein